MRWNVQDSENMVFWGLLNWISRTEMYEIRRYFQKLLSVILSGCQLIRLEECLIFAFQVLSKQTEKKIKKKSSIFCEEENERIKSQWGMCAYYLFSDSLTCICDSFFILMNFIFPVFLQSLTGFFQCSLWVTCKKYEEWHLEQRITRTEEGLCYFTWGKTSCNCLSTPTSDSSLCCVGECVWECLEASLIVFEEAMLQLNDTRTAMGAPTLKMT